MLGKKRSLSLAILIAPLPLTGCIEATTLPSFDGGLLNPDIRYLRAAEVMTGVKCAVIGFLSERETMNLKDRQDKARKTFYERVEGPHFQKFAINPETDWQKVECKQGQHRAPMRDKTGKIIRDNTGHIIAECVANENCNPLSWAFWDYKRTIKRDDNEKGKCAPVPDYSHFALDPTQSAQITFTLKAINGGFINYAKIDAKKLPDWLRGFVAPGSIQAQAPFPQLNIGGNGATTIDFSTVMPQSLHGTLFSQALRRKRRR
jgi:hypothetical protein